jgi:acetyl-CoA carboxylase carboxyltransferase component
MSDARARQERRQKRESEAAERNTKRQHNTQMEFRSIEAQELIADTLIDLRDIFSDIRDALDQINAKTTK